MAVDFGYGISVSRAIDLDALELSASKRLVGLVPSVAGCIGCGGCTACCTAGAIVDFNPRIQHTLYRRGLDTEVDVEKCMLCGKCRMVCPRRVDTRRTMLKIHDESVLL